MAQTTFDINNFIIDHVLRGTMVSTADGSVLWSLTQIKTPKLTMTSETVDAKDALGTKIMTFERAKEATFSAENAVFDLGLLAAQMGTSKKYSASDAKINTPAFEEITITQAMLTANAVTLSHTPITASVGGSSVSSIVEIFKLNGDSTFGTKFIPVSSGTTATTGKFYNAAGSASIAIFGADWAIGDRLFVMYEYAADATAGNGSVAITNSATEFPSNGKFVMEVLGADVCDSTTKVYAYLIFPNCKLSSATDLSFETEMTQALEISANQNYCSAENELWSLIIPEA